MYVVHKLINSIWKKEELPDQWNESIIVSINNKREKQAAIEHRSSSLSPYTDEII
jgi:hypothetical protein